MFENYKDCLFIEKTIFKKQQRFKSYDHDVYTKEINKVALSSDVNKRIQNLIRLQHFYKKRPPLKFVKMKCVLKAKETFKMLSKECENELYVTCNIFLNYMKTKCSREIKYLVINQKK